MQAFQSGSAYAAVAPRGFQRSSSSPGEGGGLSQSGQRLSRVQRGFRGQLMSRSLVNGAAAQRFGLGHLPPKRQRFQAGNCVCS